MPPNIVEDAGEHPDCPAHQAEPIIETENDPPTTMEANYAGEEAKFDGRLVAKPSILVGTASFVLTGSQRFP